MKILAFKANGNYWDRGHLARPLIISHTELD